MPWRLVPQPAGTPATFGAPRAKTAKGAPHVGCNCAEHFGIEWLEWLDQLVNSLDIDQLTATRMLHAPELLPGRHRG